MKENSIKDRPKNRPVWLMAAMIGIATMGTTQTQAANKADQAKGSAAAAQPAVTAPVKIPPLAPLGDPPIPPDNKQTKAKIALGKLLFFDSRLGGDASVSCSSCHDPEQGWAWAEDFSRGYPGTVHWRNSQSIIDAAYLGKQFWAGSAPSHEAQARSAARGGVAGNGEADLMEARLALIPEYRKAFKEVFGDEWPLIRNAWRAISAFERTLVQKDTPIDRYLEGDKSALGEAQLRGKKLFEGKAGCIGCHNGALATDQKYYNIGVPSSQRWEEDGLAQITFRFEQYAKGTTEEMYRTIKDDAGFYYRTKNKWDKGKFRTPTLRYVKYTAPYMHNGIFYTLEEVVDFYDRGGIAEDGRTTSFPENKTKSIKPLGLSDEEKEDLIAFIEAFSGEEIIVPKPKLPKYARLFSEDELKGVKK
uniref:Cytochrome c peroxidase n=1 Tax=Candidatus Kentrum sp. LFY TaxID=2126342 RepID=A0A450UGR2_9GAMM|nr:MAG: cytochrome c peroxidase [Candidatus Kentron sp. LFY]VFJ94246.1 MAG: cytochrome c peroxidase [Candidatus Kentron sp. LFY]